MPYLKPLLGIPLVLLLAACQREEAPTTAPAATEAAMTLPAPPVAQKLPHTVSSPHGDRVDPYYWLRDDTRQNPEMLAHLRAEQAYTEAWMQPLEPLVETIFGEIRGRIREDDASVPVLDGGWWIYSRFEAGKQYPIYARRQGSMDAPEQILLDGNAEAEGLPFYQAANVEFSDDATLMAVAEDVVGRRQFRIRIKNLASGEFLPGVIQGASGALAFSADGKHLYYVENDPTTLLAYRVRRHSVGGDPKEDAIVYTETDNTFIVDVERSKSGRYVMIDIGSTLTSEVRVLPADQPEAEPQVVLPRERGHLYSAQHLGDRFYILSNADAPNFRLVSAPVAKPADRSQWRELVPHRSDVLIEDFELFRGHIALNERRGGLRRVRYTDLNARNAQEVAGDEAAYTMRLSGTPDLDSGKLRYVYTSLTTPPETWEVDLKSGERKLLKRTEVPGGYDPSRYATEFRFAPARDGVQVPVTIVYRRDVPRDGTAPVFIEAYGSYGISRDPVFTPSRASLLDRGVVYTIAHIRGGQELGRQWYEDGKLMRKWNTFHDFIDVTDFLVKEGYAAPDRVAAWGGSAGGLLMGAVINTAPEKYRAVVAAVPFVDVITTMLDDTLPLTTLEYDEWGNPADAEAYAYMLSYSPYDQVKAQAYPSLLVSTGLHDSQVQYFEPAKWVARLRELKTDTNPLLFRINFDAGHGGASGRFDRFREIAKDYAFVLQRLGVEQPDVR